ncbi:class I SAM-dependent methyltransferase [Alphaproteobacteria bacterium]|nr:class I SAM-dependent methyltransferase [Alphaproteobacteria bacterium]
MVIQTKLNKVYFDPIKEEEYFYHNGKLITAGGKSVSIINNIPRFVDSNNYARNFGSQWNKFRKVQLDSFTGSSHSENRLASCLNSNLQILESKKILEAGCGAGRFTEILLKYGGIVHAFDYSNAVEACMANNSSNPNFSVAQADIRSMPYKKNEYDYVFCLGVLQHTPNPEKSLKYLYEMIKPGGTLCIDHYLFKFRNILPPPIGVAEVIYRWLILRLHHKVRYRVVKKIVSFWFPIHWKFRKILLIQRLLRRFSPVHFYYSNIELSGYNEYYQWALLDTHDGTTDKYRHHRSIKSIRKTLEKLGLENVVVKLGGNGVEAVCTKPLVTKNSYNETF